MIQDISYFNHTLEQMEIKGTHKKIWLKQFKKDPKKATQQFYEKLERMYNGWGVWEFAKKLLIQHHPHLGHEVPPQKPRHDGKKTWEEIYEENHFKWGDAMYDYELLLQ